MTRPTPRTGHLVVGGATVLVVGLLVAFVGRRADAGVLGPLRPVASVGAPLFALAGASVALSQGLLAWSDRRRGGGRTDGREPSLLRRARWAVLVAAGLVLVPGAAVTGGGVEHVTSLPLAASGLLVVGWLAVEVAVGVRRRLAGRPATHGSDAADDSPAPALLSTENRVLLASAAAVALLGGVAVVYRLDDPAVAVGLVGGVGVAAPQAYLAVRGGTGVPARSRGRVAVATLALLLAAVGTTGEGGPIPGGQASRVLAGVLVVSWIVVEAYLHSREATTG